jgi:hypothetical protein
MQATIQQYIRAIPSKRNRNIATPYGKIQIS